MKDQNWFPLDIKKIRTLLPHRYPFLLVDSVLNITSARPGEVVGRVCTARKNVTGNEWFFQGHFPDNPVMPGVLVLEALAQTGALCCGGVKGDRPIKELFFAGVDKVRFKKPVFPGDVLDLQVEMKKQKATFFFGTATAFVEKEVSARAEITAHIVFS